MSDAPGGDVDPEPLPDEATLRQIIREHRMFREAVENSPVHFCLYDEADRLIAWNPSYEVNHPEAFAALRAKGAGATMSYAEIIRYQMSRTYTGRELDARVDTLVAMQRESTGDPVEREYPSVGWLRVYKYNLPSGAVAGLAFKINDLKVTQDALEQKASALAEAYQQMRSDALHDVLTGLPNRRYLNLYLANLEEQLVQIHDRLTVFHIDLDQFKALNDSLGHAAGDKALQHVGQQLRKCLAGEDFVARSGGDEFTYFHFAVGADAETFAKRLASAIAEPFQFDSTPCSIRASIGAARLENKSISFRELLANADLALYQAKNHEESLAVYGT